MPISFFIFRVTVCDIMQQETLRAFSGASALDVLQVSPVCVAFMLFVQRPVRMTRAVDMHL